MKNQLTPEQRKACIERGFLIGGLCLAAFVIAPIVHLIIVGLLGGIVSVAIAAAAIKFADVFGQLIGTWRLQALKAIIAAHPVEALEMIAMEKDAALQEALHQHELFLGQRNTYESQVQEFKKVCGADEAAQYNRELGDMNQGLETMEQEIEQSQDNLARFKQEIVKARARWKMQLSAKAAGVALASLGENFMMSLKTDTAFTAITESMNNSFASLQSSVLRNRRAVPVSAPLQQLPAPTPEDLLKQTNRSEVVNAVPVSNRRR